MMQLFLWGTGITMIYIIVAVGIMLLVRKLITIPDELFRKILHFILLGAYIPLSSHLKHGGWQQFLQCR